MDADQNVLQKQIMRSITHCGDMFYDITLIAHTWHKLLAQKV